MTQLSEKRGRWVAICFCRACNHRLSRADLAHGSGRCPHCGAQSEGSTPDYYVRKHRSVTTYRKWMGLVWVPVSRHFESQGPVP